MRLDARSLAAIAIVVLSVPGFVRAQQSPQAEIAAAMAKAKQFTQPGPNHKVLERFIGAWSTETRVFGMGKPMPAEKGSAQFAWLMPGRWVKSESSGSMMGMQIQSFMLLGYDNFKQSFVFSGVSTMDTFMSRLEGDLDQSGKTLIAYGTLDEYLTGEHDKMVKYVWRFQSTSQMLLEVHDLAIGEANTKVIEISFTKK